MPTRAMLLIFPWIASGIGLLAGALALDFRFPEPARFATCLVLALLGSTFKIKLPRMQGTFSISFVLTLIAIAQMTLTEALVIGVLATLVQCLWRARKRPTLLQVLFNVSTLVVSVVLAFAVLNVLRDSGALIPGLVIAAVLFFIVNSGLVSLVLALLNSQSAISIWRNCHRWAFPYYICGALVAGLVTVCSQVCGWRLAFGMLPLMYMMYSCYESWIVAQTQDESQVAVG
jgi:hypothetical protein